MGRGAKKKVSSLPFQLLSGHCFSLKRLMERGQGICLSKRDWNYVLFVEIFQFTLQMGDSWFSNEGKVHEEGGGGVVVHFEVDGRSGALGEGERKKVLYSCDFGPLLRGFGRGIFD